MFRKLEKRTERSRQAEMKLADDCECNCAMFGRRGEAIQPAENKTVSKLSLHFVIKG